MFCPNCGMEQASESMHYCSRCGFKLNTVEDGLVKRLFTIAMFLVVTAFAFFGWSSFTATPAYMQVRVVITVFAAITFYLLFLPDLRSIHRKLFSRSIEQSRQVTSANHESGLPPAQSVPVPLPSARRVNTAEMVHPPSITEQTTTLLDKNRT